MRSTEEWIGKTDDQAIPLRVRARVFELKRGRCHRCKRKIGVGDRWTCEHMIAIENGGENRESNLDVTCDWCLPIKNRKDAATKRKGTKVRYAHMGLRPEPTIRSRGFAKRSPQRTATRPVEKGMGS